MARTYRVFPDPQPDSFPGKPPQSVQNSNFFTDDNDLIPVVLCPRQTVTLEWFFADALGDI